MRELLDMPREVAVSGYGAGDDDAIVVIEANQAAVEGPVAELAQGQAVGGAVVMGHCPVLDVCGVDHRVAIRGFDADTAQGAAVVVDLDDDPAECLVPDGFFHGLFVGRRHFPEESVCIVEGGKLGACQVEQGLFQGWYEAAADQVPSGRGAVDGALQLLERSFIEGCESVPLPHILPGGRLRGRQRLAGDRVKRPEPVCLQIEEGQVDARAQTVGQEGVPVEQERVGQVLVGHDPVFRDPACLHEVEHGQEQEWLVRCPAEGLGRPGASVGILPDGRKGEWWLEHGAL